MVAELVLAGVLGYLLGAVPTGVARIEPLFGPGESRALEVGPDGSLSGFRPVHELEPQQLYVFDLEAP